jgi:hydroxylamine reductase (hybrid-cluster protein)
VARSALEILVSAVILLPAGVLAIYFFGVYATRVGRRTESPTLPGGMRSIRMVPTLPAFLSPNVAKAFEEKFNIKPIESVAEDIAAMMAGQ